VRSPDVSKAERLLGFRAETPLGTVLDEVVPWIREQIERGRI
jgi:UDP-glucose 4-epimerase